VLLLEHSPLTCSYTSACFVCSLNTWLYFDLYSAFFLNTSTWLCVFVGGWVWTFAWVFAMPHKLALARLEGCVRACVRACVCLSVSMRVRASAHACACTHACMQGHACTHAQERHHATQMHSQLLSPRSACMHCHALPAPSNSAGYKPLLCAQHALERCMQHCSSLLTECAPAQQGCGAAWQRTPTCARAFAQCAPLTLSTTSTALS